MDSIKSQLELLSEDPYGNVNYVSWRFKLDLTLKSKKLYTVATGQEVRPTGGETEQQVKSWIEKDNEAQIFIGLNVSSNIARKIANCKSASQMLKKLETLYGKKSDLTIEGLQRNFFSYKYDTSKSVIQNCMQIQEYAEDLAAEGEAVKESWIMSRILGMLPPKLHHFRTAWDNVAASDKNLDTLFERLRLEEDRLNETEQSNVSQNALVSKQNKCFVKASQQEKPTVQCFKCGKNGHVKKYCRNKPCAKYLAYCRDNYSCNNCKQKGHFARECPNVTCNETNEKSDSKESKGFKRKALVNVGLSIANINEINLQPNRKNTWYQDCGATQHMTFRKDWLINYVKLDHCTKVLIGDATELEGIGVGDIELEAFDGEQWYDVVLENVLYVPDINFNLFSVTQVLDKGYVQSANADISVFKTADNLETVAIGRREQQLYKMLFRTKEFNKCMTAISIKKWHEKLAHQNVTYVRDVLNRNGIDYIDDWNDYVCVGCIYGKQHHKSHPTNFKIAENTLDVIHVDLCEMNLMSLGGAKYFLLFKDDFSHFRTVYFLKTKDEAVAKLEAFMKMVENQFGKKVKCLKSDNGTEIKNAHTKKLLDELGVFHIRTNTYTPQQNGRIEREMRTVVESARSAIHARKLNENLWAEAINYAVFTLNQTGRSSVKGKSPAELWFGRRIDLTKMRSFGCDCYVLIEDHKRRKTEKKSKKGIFVGYELDSPCYRIYLPDEMDVVASDNVIFDERTEDKEEATVVKSFTGEERNETEYNYPEGNQISDDSLYDVSEECSVSSDYKIQNRNSPPKLRDRQNLRQPVRFTDYEMDLVQHNNNAKFGMIGEIEDISVSNALKDKNWYKAMSDEYKSLIKLKTWTLVEPPKNVKPLTCRWVLRKKQDGRYKARLVARGFEQEEGLDYSETFSPVARYESIRLLLSIAATNKMKIKTFDVKTAFLYSDLHEEIYMNQPDGFNDGTNRVCKLKKSLYGLKQAPKKWMRNSQII